MEAEHQLIEAIKAGDTEGAIQILSEDPSAAFATDSAGLSALLLSLYYRRKDIVELILAERGRENLDIFEAAALDDKERLAELIKNGQDIESFSPDGFNPLQLAAYFGNAGAAGMLLQAGASLTLKSTNAMGVQPIHAALAGSHFELATFLLESGASPKEASAEGWTPLHYAAAMGEEALTRVLLSKGADRYAETTKGLTAADLAEQNGHEVIVELLRPPS